MYRAPKSRDFSGCSVAFEVQKEVAGSPFGTHDVTAMLSLWAAF